MIVQNAGLDGTTDLTFTVHRNDFDSAKRILVEQTRDMGAREVTGDNRIVKISLVGWGCVLTPASPAGCSSVWRRRESTYK